MPTRPNPSVVRCLFPDPDLDRQAKHDNSMNSLKDIIAADAERMRIRWNYDAENDQPLDGTVKWEKPGDSRYHWIGYISREEDNCHNDLADQVQEVDPRCKTKAVDEIDKGTYEEPKVLD